MINFEQLPAGILSRIPDTKEVLVREERVVFAYLFRGIATGRTTPLFDVDICDFLSDMQGSQTINSRSSTC